MRILYMTNYPAPYRVDFFNKLGEKCDLTVTFEESPAMQKHRDTSWFCENYKNFNAVFLKKSITRNGHLLMSTQIFTELKKKYDAIIVGIYSTGTSMAAIAYMKIHQISYWIETDGGMIKEENAIKRRVKKMLISGATGYFSPSIGADEYLSFYGADENKIHRYPFTSLTNADIKNALILSKQQKQNLRFKLNMTESKVLLSVGRFSYKGGYGKGYDTLLEVAEKLSPDIGIYIVGDKPTNEFIEWKKEKNLTHVHFIGCKGKTELAEYYAAADAFVLLARGDVWGLVVNEAMSFGLPVITTYQCVAGKELVKEGKNGYLVNAGDSEKTEAAIKTLFGQSEEDYETMRINCFDVIKNYSIENMTIEHFDVLGRGEKREILKMYERFVVLYVGQMIYRKGIDILLSAARKLPNEIGVYLVGGNPTAEYLEMIKAYNITNVHFEGFKNKKELESYYRAADMFVLPTREDVWGLVINEAMAFGLPCISTNKCGAALELIENEKTGYILENLDADSLCKKILDLYQDDRKRKNMQVECLKKISRYTIENMVEEHIALLEK